MRGSEVISARREIDGSIQTIKELVDYMTADQVRELLDILSENMEKCKVCNKEVVWYYLENHLDKHYEDGDFADREAENRIAQEGSKRHGIS